MAKRRILQSIQLDKIAAVDRPCQEHAIVTIMKRDAPPPEVKDLGPLRERMVKQLILLPPAQGGTLEKILECDAWCKTKTELGAPVQALKHSLTSILGDVSLDETARGEQLNKSVGQFLDLAQTKFAAAPMIEEALAEKRFRDLKNNLTTVRLKKAKLELLANLEKAWSEEARRAAAEARRHKTASKEFSAKAKEGGPDRQTHRTAARLHREASSAYWRSAMAHRTGATSQAARHGLALGAISGAMVGGVHGALIGGATGTASGLGAQFAGRALWRRHARQLGEKADKFSGGLSKQLAKAWSEQDGGPELKKYWSDEARAAATEARRRALAHRKAAAHATIDDKQEEARHHHEVAYHYDRAAEHFDRGNLRRGGTRLIFGEMKAGLRLPNTNLKRLYAKGLFMDKRLAELVKTLRTVREITELLKKLPKDAEAKDYIHDFVHSDNPRFKGKSKQEIIRMALGAYYGSK